LCNDATSGCLARSVASSSASWALAALALAAAPLPLIALYHNNLNPWQAGFMTVCPTVDRNFVGVSVMLAVDTLPRWALLRVALRNRPFSCTLDTRQHICAQEVPEVTMQMTCAEAVTVLQGRDPARSKRDQVLAALSLVKILEAGRIQQVQPLPPCILCRAC